MENVPGFTAVRYEPSRLRPRSVIAAVEIELFLGAAFPRDEGKVEVQWRPRDGIDVQRVHWADEAVSLGWHKDDDHIELGTTHFQLESDGTIVHEPAYIEVEAPLRFLEICLSRLPEKLRETEAD